MDKVELRRVYTGTNSHDLMAVFTEYDPKTGDKVTVMKDLG
jgi:hypothetical protein